MAVGTAERYLWFVVAYWHLILSQTFCWRLALSQTGGRVYSNANAVQTVTSPYDADLVRIYDVASEWKVSSFRDVVRVHLYASKSERASRMKIVGSVFPSLQMI
jgi:hypothetical protein